MRLPRRVWSLGVFEYCPAPLAGVAVRRGSGVVLKVVGGSDGGGGKMMAISEGRKSPEYEKQTRTQNTPTEHTQKSTYVQNTTHHGSSLLRGTCLWKEVSDTR